MTRRFGVRRQACTIPLWIGSAALTGKDPSIPRVIQSAAAGADPKFLLIIGHALHSALNRVR